MPSPRRIVSSWLVPPAVVLAAAGVQAGFWLSRDGDETMQVMSAWFIWPSAVLTLLLWWLFLSPLRWRKRLIGLASVAAGFGLFFLIFRFDGFSGGFRPMLSPRWRPEPEAIAAAYFRQSAAEPSARTTGSTRILTVRDGDWPQFRGPRRDGVVRGARIRTDWDERPPQALWRHPVGPAWSSFAVVDGLILTQEQRGDEETVACYDLGMGTEVWKHADAGRFETPLGGVGPLATPTVVDSRAYVLGPTGRLLCLDAATGELLWRRNILEDAGVGNTLWGMSGSPLVYDDVVVVNPGGDSEHDTGVTAYDRETGERRWAAGRHPASYTAPQLATIDGVRQVLIFDGDGLGGHDADTGRELWRFEWTNSQKINVAAPILRDDGTILVSTSYGTGAALVSVRHHRDDWTADTTGWKTSKQLKLKFNDPVVKDGFIYGMDEGILACFDPATGRRKWKGGRYGYGQLLLLAEQERLLVLSEQGRVALVEATPERFDELTGFDAIHGKTWNHPVIVDGLLLVRNAEEAACYDLRP